MSMNTTPAARLPSHCSRFASRTLTAAALLGLLGLALASSAGAATTTSTKTAGKAATKTASAPAVKSPISGLADRHHAPSTAYSGAVRSFVVDTTWASLQPVKGGPIVHPNDIDNAITLAKANGETLKLRVRAGIDAPTWAKTLDGPALPFYYTDATPGLSGTLAGTVGRFWLPDFNAAYASLQQKLAADYDAVPQIRETDITECATIYSETFLRDAMYKGNVTTLLKAGYTLAQDATCHAQQVQAHRVWVQTPSDLSFNPYNSITSDGKVRADLAYTESQMVYCRQVLGARCVLSNHSLATGRSQGGNYGAMYAYMHSLGGSIDFQTATVAKMGDYTAVLAYAASLGAHSVELPTGYTDWSTTTLAGYAREMADS